MSAKDLKKLEKLEKEIKSIKDKLYKEVEEDYQQKLIEKFSCYKWILHGSRSEIQPFNAEEALKDRVNELNFEHGSGLPCMMVNHSEGSSISYLIKEPNDVLERLARIYLEMGHISSSLYCKKSALERAELFEQYKERLDHLEKLIK